MSPSSSVPSTRSELGGYRLNALLARSAPSLLFRGAGIQAGEEVLIEVPREGLRDAEGFVDSMRRDAVRAAELQHPHVARSAVTGVDDGVPYAVSPDPDGVELTPLVEGLGGLSMARAASIIGQVAGGLAAAHAAGLVHGTLEPARILVVHRDGADHAVLTGFGFSPPAGAQGRAARPFGVPAAGFTAPELIRAGEPTIASDVYALGCILYHALVAEGPATGPNESAVLNAHLNTAPVSLAQRAPELPAELDAVVARALAKNPAERHTSADEFAADLEAILGGAAPQATVSARKQDTKQRWEQSIAGGAHSWSPSEPVLAWPQPVEGSEDEDAPDPEPEPISPAAQSAPLWPQPHPDEPESDLGKPKRPKKKPAQAPRKRRTGRVVAALAAAAAVTALVVLLVSGDDDSGSDRAAREVPPPAKPDNPAPAAGAKPATDGLIPWPARDAYTVIVAVSEGDRAVATAASRRAARLGFRAGVLESGKYPNLPPGRLVGFVGVYDSKAQATAAARRLRSRGVARSPYVRLVRGGS